MNYTAPEFKIIRDKDRCIECGACVRQCAFEAHFKDKVTGELRVDDYKCVDCQRCVCICPSNALSVIPFPNEYRANSNWNKKAIDDINRQAESGAVLLGAMGNPLPYKTYWDHILLNASQVTNPSIDPLREPMETKVFLGGKPDRLEIEGKKILTKIPPTVKIELPIMFSAMSFGSISLNAQKSMAAAAKACGTLFNTGEGGMHEDIYPYADNSIVQVASGRFGINRDYLMKGRIVEIKIGQGAKPGIGGHLPGEKVDEEVSKTRMVPLNSDAISPAPHHDIYSIEDLRQLIYSIKELTGYSKPVSVKIAAVHNAAAIASGSVRAGADIIVLDGYRGGTGATPERIRDHVGIPVELALAVVDQRLRDEGIRHKASLVIAGSVRSSAEIVKAIALGADAVYVASSALIAMGCHMCAKCYTGKCNWGIATQRPDLTKRLNPEIMIERLTNLLNGWKHEIRDIMGGMGINAVECLRGNRLMLKGIGLNAKELEILGIAHAGE
jgi:glutamate synthase domain-containing protein 2